MEWTYKRNGTGLHDVSFNPLWTYKSLWCYHDLHLSVVLISLLTQLLQIIKFTINLWKYSVKFRMGENGNFIGMRNRPFHDAWHSPCKQKLLDGSKEFSHQIISCYSPIFRTTRIKESSLNFQQCEYSFS